MPMDDCIPYGNYEELKKSVLGALMSIIRRTKGNCVTFTSKKIAITAGLPPTPVLLTVIRDILEGLHEDGLISRYSKGSHGVKYMITRNSPLWQWAKTVSIQEVATLLATH